MDVTPQTEHSFLPDSLFSSPEAPLPGGTALSGLPTRNSFDAAFMAQRYEDGEVLLPGAGGWSGAGSQRYGRLDGSDGDFGPVNLSGDRLIGPHQLQAASRGDSLTQTFQAQPVRPLLPGRNGQILRGTASDDRFIVTRPVERTIMRGFGGNDLFNVARFPNGGLHRLIGDGGRDDFVVGFQQAPRRHSIINDFRPADDTLFFWAWNGGNLTLQQQGAHTMVRAANGRPIVLLANLNRNSLTASDFRGARVSTSPPPPPAPRPILSIAANGGGSVSERDAGQQSTAGFTVSLNRPVTQPVTVRYRTIPQTATANSDYRTTMGTLRFVPGGPRSQAVTVPVIGDDNLENPETFLVRLENPSANALLGSRQAQMRIADNDVEEIRERGNRHENGRSDDIGLSYRFDIYPIDPNGRPRIDMNSDPTVGVFTGAIENFTTDTPVEFDPFADSDGATVSYSGLTLDLQARFIAANNQLEYAITGTPLSSQAASDGRRIVEIALVLGGLTGIDTDRAVNCLDYIIEEGLLNRIDLDDGDIRISTVASNSSTVTVSNAQNLFIDPPASTTNRDRVVRITDPDDLPPPVPPCPSGSAA